MSNKKYFFFIISIILLLILIKGIIAETNITGCGTTQLYAPGTYVLNDSINGTATCLTINSSDVEINCNGYNISFNSGGLASNYGINVINSVTPISNITIKNCIIQDINLSGSTGNGIAFTRVSNSLIFNNTIMTNGTTGNYGIYFTTGSKNNIIENNTIYSLGTTTANYGIYFLQTVENNTIKGNVINASGNSTSSALYLSNDCDKNLILNNTFLSFQFFGGLLTGNSDGHVIQILTSGNNNITGNYIYGRAASRNYGIYIVTNSEGNIIENNNISMNTTGATNYGVYLLYATDTVIDRNSIYVNGSGTLRGVVSTASAFANITNNNITINNYAATFDGILISSSQLNMIINNNITLNGTGTLNGVYTTSSPLNQIVNNTIQMFNGSTLNGIYTLYSDSNIINNNVLQMFNGRILNGIFTSSSPLNNISNNTVFLNGTATLNGIYTSSSASNIIDNNSVFLNGTTLNGVYSLYSPYTNIKNNTVFLNGTTLNGIFTSSSASNIIDNNSIFLNGTTTLNGVYTASSPSNIIQNNLVNLTGPLVTKNGINIAYGTSTIIKNNSVEVNGTTPLYGIYLYPDTISSIVEGNNITTRGTAANPAVFLSTASNNNTIKNNTLITRGTTTLNYGIQVTSSNNNTFEYNNISTNGTTTNYGIYLLTHSNYNNLSYNTVLTNGTTTNYGIFLSSASNNLIKGNNISTGGTTLSGATNNWGIHFAVNSEDNQIYNNTINTSGGGSNYGLSLITTSVNNTYRGNNIYPNGNGTLNIGAYLAEASENDFEDNVIATNGTTTSYGFYFYSSSKNNLVKNNNISTLGNNSYAFNFLFLTPGNYPSGNNLSGNNLLNISARDLNFSTASINGTWIINQQIRNYSFLGVGGTINFKNESAGQIVFLENVSGINTTLTDRIFITNNLAVIDKSARFLNRSANITLFNIPTTSTELAIYRNNSLCPSTICANLTSLQAGNVTFNVTDGGNYSILPSSSLPQISLNLPANGYSTNQQSISFNFTSTDDSPGNLNCSIYINSTLNQTNQSINYGDLANFLIENLSEGNYSWYIECMDSAGNKNSSETRNFAITIAQPSNRFNYPSNNSYLNNINSVLLNYTVFDNDSRNMNVWLYGDDILLNYSENIANGTNLAYTLGGLGLGKHNWSIRTGNSIKNSSLEYGYFNIINLTINCEARGPYKSGAVVPVYGNISNGTDYLNSQSINISLYKNNVLNTSSTATTTSEGYFSTVFSGLNNGNYTVNANATYQGINKSCTDNFLIDSSASFSIDKIISLYNINSTSLTYNITIRLTNRGGSNATGVNISDLNYNDSYFIIGTLGSEETITRSYLLSFIRNSTTYYNSSAIAQAEGVDSFSGELALANSTSINLTIPSQETGQQLTLVKNIIYNSQTSERVNYTINISVINSGGIDLNGIVIDDQNLNLTTVQSLNKSNSYTYSDSFIISKEQTNLEYLFYQTTATVNTIQYKSNLIEIIVPGYGNGPNDLIVEAPASVTPSTAFSTTITILNMNPDIGQDFTIDYWITNMAETTNYSIGSKTLFVPADSGSNQTIVNFNSPTGDGNYKFMAKIRESGKDASDSFVVASPRTETPSDSGGGGGGGSVSGKIIYETKNEDIEIGKTQALNDGEKVKFNIIQNKIVYSYSLEIVDLQSNKATITIYSPPITLLLYINEEKKLDLNADGYYDLYVKLEKIENNKAYVYIKSLYEEIEGKKLHEDENKSAKDIEKQFSEDKSGIFNNIKASILQNILYLFIAFAIGIVFIILIIAIILSKKFRIKISQVKPRLEHRKRINENLKKIKKGHLLIALLSFFAVIPFIFIKNNLTGFAIKEENSFSNNSGIIWIFSLIAMFGILLFAYRKKMLEFISSKKKKYPCNRIKGLIKKKVYSDEGIYVGEVRDIILGENKIESLKIKLDKKHKFNKKGITISYKHVKAIKEIVIVDDKILENLAD